MTFHFFIFVLSGITSAIHAQTYELLGADTINRVDLEGKKQGRWVVFGRHKAGSCYQKEQKVEEGRYQDNRKTGIWIDYHCNGKMRNRLTFVNGRPDGLAQMYHDNGKISEEGTWRNNRWVGNYKLYYSTGEVQHDFVFGPTGKREGAQKYYHENGSLAIEGNFVNGKESGVIREYYENGDIKVEKNFADGAVDAASIKEYLPKAPLPVMSDIASQNAPPVKVRDDEKPNEAAKIAVKGVLNGPYVLYNKNKQITKDGVFKDNRFIDGKAYFYNENGILQRVAVYKDGLYIGDTQPE